MLILPTALRGIEREQMAYVIERHRLVVGTITLQQNKKEMSQNAAMLTKIAQMEAVIADLRSMLSDPTPPTTPVKAVKAAQVPDAPMKAGAKSLSEADLDAMVRAGMKVGAQIKTLGKTVFGPLGIPEYSWGVSREQWKEYRTEISDDEAEALASEPVLTEEICETLKSGTDPKTKKPFDATTRTKKLAVDLADHDIHPVLFEKAGKEWREWAEVHGLGKRPKAPSQSSRTVSPKSPKADLPALLTTEMLETIRGSTDKHGKPFYVGSQKRMLADTLSGLGIEEADHVRATKEWKAYAKAEGISREGSQAGSTKGSEGVPEGLTEGVGPVVESTTTKPVTKPAAAAASTSSVTKTLTPTQCVRISDMFSANSMPADLDIRKALRLIGIPHDTFTEAVVEWREWATDNHRAKEEDDLEVDLGFGDDQ